MILLCWLVLKNDYNKFFNKLLDLLKTLFLSFLVNVPNLAQVIKQCFFIQYLAIVNNVLFIYKLILTKKKDIKILSLANRIE
jgi:hypothetical protein